MSLKLAKQVNALNSVESASLGLAKLAGIRGQITEAKVELETLYSEAIAAERYEFAEKIQTELGQVLSNDKQYEAAFLS